MPYITARLGASTARNVYPIQIGFDNQGAARVAIHSYQFDGLAGVGPIYVRIRNQPTTPVLGNWDADAWPLGNATGTNVYTQFSNPIVIEEGDNQWNGSHLLEISLFDTNHNPLTFSEGFILFVYIARDPHNVKDERDEVKRPLVKETYSRNAIPLPGPFRWPNVDSILRTSYPMEY